MTPSDPDLLSDARRRLPAAREALRAATGDMPASGGSGGNTGPSDRTGRLACHEVKITSGNAEPKWVFIGLNADEAIADSRKLDKLIEVMLVRCRRGEPITRQLQQVLDICDRWAPTERRRRALDANLRAAADDLLNKHDDHGNCRSCKRVPGAWGEPHKDDLCKTCQRHIARILALYDVDQETAWERSKKLVEIGERKYKVTDQDIHVVMHGSTRRV